MSGIRGYIKSWVIIFLCALVLFFSNLFVFKNEKGYFTILFLMFLSLVWIRKGILKRSQPVINKDIKIFCDILMAAFGVVILILGFFYVKNIYYEGYQAEKAGRQWQTLAENESNPELTLENAHKWLDGHNFHVLFWNPHDHEGWIGAEYQFNAVTGYVVRGSQKIKVRQIFSKSLWLTMTFKFDINKRFDRVTYEIRSLDENSIPG